MGILTAHNEGTPVCNFRNSAKTPIRSLKFHFSPTQAGSGDPSPDNVREIQGWNSLDWWKTGKNVGQVKNYGASTFNYDTTPSTTNSYGTSLNSTTYNLPDTVVVITQSKWPQTSDLKHYQNGYFTINVPNLIFGQYYDVSFKITNIVNNPLNASLSQLTLINPGGNQYGPNKILNDSVLIFKNVFFKQRTNMPKCYCFDVRICGMSFTLSEFMVTPAYQNDGVFEPFKGEKTTFTFPSIGKNLLNLEVPTHQFGATIKSSDLLNMNEKYIGWIYNGNSGWIGNTPKIENILISNGNLSFINTSTSTTTGIGYVVFLKEGQTYTMSCSNCTNGRFICLYFTKDKIYKSARGSNTFPYSFTIPSGTYFTYILFYDITHQSPVSFSNLQLELSSSATTYEPYSATNTVYGGYIDLGKGEIWQTHMKITDDNGNHWNVSESETSLRRVMVNVSTFQQGEPMAREQTDCKANYIKTVTSANVAWGLAEHPLEFTYELATPILLGYFIPIDLETFLDHNVFWSNAEGEVEIDYDLHEVRAMTLAKKQAMTYPHHKKVVWNQLAAKIESGSKWEPYNTNNISATISDNLAEITPLKSGVGYSFSLVDKNYPQVYIDHIYYASYMGWCNKNTTIGFEYAGGRQSYNTPITADTWTRASIRNSSNKNGSGAMYIPFPVDAQTTDIYKIKSPIYIDLTLMFGAGKEPTKAEFEHLCALNNIDLTQYYPKNTTGTEQWWIVP